MPGKVPPCAAHPPPEHRTLWGPNIKGYEPKVFCKAANC
jgi:hypothetical protein